MGLRTISFNTTRRRLWRGGPFSLSPEEDVENFTHRDLVQALPADRLVRM
jgi:hypothetical protein